MNHNRCRSTGWYQALLLLLAVFVFPGAATALDQTLHTPRFTLKVGKAPGEEADTAHLERLAQASLHYLEDNYKEFSGLFGVEPREPVVVRILSPRRFRQETGAPEWTNAMFFRGEISVPATSALTPDSLELKNALRHEYIHAVIAELSNSRCPAWLDEGLAQLLEGAPNPILGPALRSWLGRNRPIPLQELHDGFMAMDEDMVAVAYAQSLVAARILVKQHGVAALVAYLQELRKGFNPKRAFSRAFGEELSDFEATLEVALNRWSASGLKTP